MNAEKHNLDRIYFGGGFIRGSFDPSQPTFPQIKLSVVSVYEKLGHAATISTLSYAIRFWSKGTKRALFLRHEGYVGGIGAFVASVMEEGGERKRR